MAFSTNGAKGLSAEINVTPLIDVLLVLLIIFMVIVPMAPSGLKVTNPMPPKPDAAEDSSNPLVLQVEARGGSQADAQDDADVTYKINGTVIANEELDAKLRELMAMRSNRQMFVQADPRFHFGVVAYAVDRARGAGAETVALLTPGLKR